MEEKKDNGTTKGLLILIVVFFMIIAGMVGFGLSGYSEFNILQSPDTGVSDKSNTDEEKPAKNNEDKGDKEEHQDRKENVKLPKTDTDSKLAAVRTSDLSDVVEKVMPSLVAITTEGEESIVSWFGEQTRKTQDMGSGVIVDKDQRSLYIITNNHVIDGATKLVVAFEDGSTAKGEVKGTAAYTDLALVEVKLDSLAKKTLDRIKVAGLGDSNGIKVGQMVMAIGNALGYGQSLTVGYVSAKDRVVNINDITMKLIQTDAAINPGNSGGALLNLNGEVVGINSAKFSDRAVEGMGYAIPMATVKPLINELKTKKNITDTERGYLGIYYREIDDASHEAFNMPYGLYITDVADNGGAKKAGLIKGDIIVAVNDNETLKADAINSIILGKKKGEQVKVTFYRYENGEYVKKDVNVTLAERPKTNN